MAKNITLMGANYPDVPAVQLPQTGGGTATFYDADEIIKSDTVTGTTSGAGILYCDIPRDRIILFMDCPGNCIANLNYPVGHTSMLLFTTNGDKLYPVINTSVTIKYYYYKLKSGTI